MSDESAWRPTLLRPIPPHALADPYPHYAELRAAGTILEASPGLWFVLGHAEVTAALRHPRLLRSPPAPAAAPPESPDWLEWLRAEVATPEGRAATVGLTRLWMINLDPPEHPPLRRSAGRELAAARLVGYRGRIEAIAGDLLDPVVERGPGELDLMREFALPLPARVIADLLGVPPSDRERAVALAARLVPAISGEATAEGAAATLARAGAATLELAELFVELSRSPGAPHGLLAHFRAAGLAEPVAVAQALLLFFAGEETTANWIGNGVAAWLDAGLGASDWPGAEEEADTALEELLRFDSPVQLTFRRSAGAELGGRRIPEGDYAVLFLGAANRESGPFRAPDRVEPGRDPNPHVAFGGGLHGCLGAALARLEAEVAFRALFLRLPGLAAAPGRRRRPGLLLRGYAALPLVWGAGAAGARLDSPGRRATTAK